MLAGTEPKYSQADQHRQALQAHLAQLQLPEAFRRLPCWDRQAEAAY